MTGQTPIFFTSIPKCGKNLIYSFCFALDMQRYAWGEIPSVLHRAHFARISDKQNYAFPESGAPSAEEVAQAWRDAGDRIANFPKEAIAHHHFLPDERLTRLLAEAPVNSIFVTRDPRDVLLSMLHFARQRELPAHVHAMLQPLSDEDALLFLLEGGDALIPFADYFDAYHGWLFTPDVHVLRFEDLVGPRGGGDAERQIETCRLLTQLGGLTPDDAAFERALGRMFNEKAGTFFRGQIGAWREGFSPEVKRRYEQCAGGLAARWGYAE